MRISIFVVKTTFDFKEWGVCMTECTGYTVTLFSEILTINCKD